MILYSPSHVPLPLTIMVLPPLDDLLQQRLAQLKSIADRRNDLLREMYFIMRRRNNASQIFALADQHEEEDLHSFLQRFDISEHPDDGSILNLCENELFTSEIRQVSSPPLAIDATTVSTPRARSSTHVHDATYMLSVAKEKTPPTTEPGKEDFRSSVTPSKSYPRHVLDDESEDELDLFGSYHRKTPSQESSGVPNKAAESGTDVINILEDDFIDGEGDIENEEEEEDDQKFESKGADSLSPSLIDQQVPLSEGVSDDDKMSVDEDGIEEEEVSTPVRSSGAELAQLPASLIEQESIAFLQRVDDAMDIESDSNVKALPDSVPPQRLLRPQLAPIQYDFPIKTPRPIFIYAPEAPSEVHHYTFKLEPETTHLGDDESAPTPSTLLRSGPHPKYSLPPLKSLPAEYHRKSKSKQRKRDKERDKYDSKRDVNKDDWVPMGLNKWAATINTNPLWKRMARATKCISTRDWGVAMTELRLSRAVDRIESLKDAGLWSFRQPKKQRGVGGLVKSHWDYLMDEMKWMRIDFREERKWKMALAYNLSTSVLEWHAAKSWSERVARGVAVRWKRPLPATKDPSEDVAEEPVPASEYQHREHSNASMLGLDYGSEEEDEDEQDREVIDALQPSTLLEEALETENSGPTDDSSMVCELKKEEMEDQHALGDLELLLDVSQCSITNPNEHPEAALKATSQDVMLGFNPDAQTQEEGATLGPAKLSPRPSIYAPIRERVAYSDDQQLFLDLADLCLDESLASHSINEKDEHFPYPSDISIIFADFQPLGLLDVAPTGVPSAVEGRKKSDKRNDKDDPNKRPEDTTYSKLFPASQFMRSKPTLLGPLQPSKKWNDGSWAPVEESPIIPDHDGVSVKVPEDANLNELFENRSSNSAAAFWQAAAMKDTRRRTSDHVWTAGDDTLLKSCIDKYPYNWYLIAECFNASRVTISTDKRSARDCLDRWREKWGSEWKLRQQDPNATLVEGTPQSSSSQNQINTRGVKRMASVSISSPTTSFSATGPEPRKRRRHMLMQETIRKYAKKRIETLQKANAQRKPNGIHETHGQYAKLPKLSPAELIRLKAERDAREQQEILARKRHVEELGRQVIQARLSQQAC
ncbi:hypothetical protein M378DRAFT_690339 [Amanita muscaria Koide BX008]|uniref:Vacuolar import and degradation protein 21 n=1 Tax=Amanita muscaria (strain Koide BX008) TaxID=946122 RepID=A0A0C2X5N6_AMAMK|nr:hypothetical protein M378DRAFT_690339 [Amanita muscaria Koide BX008]